MRTPSIRQQAIYDKFDNSTENILIEAVAGSGKTTVLLEIVKRCDYRVLYVAFNKSIQIEVQEHLIRENLNQGKAMTMHSLGLLAIRKKYGKFKLNNSKNFEIIRLVRSSKKQLFDEVPIADRMKLTYMLMDMNDISRIYLTVNIDEIKERMVAMDKPCISHRHLRALWLEVLKYRDMFYKRTVIEIDFIDMIFIPVHESLHIPIKATYLLTDECQDLNGAQHQLLNNLINQGDIERWVSAGDRNQSIYGFSGSHESSFDLFKEKDNVIELPLDICYRLPVDVLIEANKVYDVMQGFKTNPGNVGEITDCIHIKDDSMVICRNTAPLIELYFQLIGLRKTVYIKGEDIMGKIVKAIKPFKKNRIEYILDNMFDEMESLKDSEDKWDNIRRYKLEENRSMIKNLVLGGFVKPFDKGQDLLDNISELFDDKDGGIILCTIHKAKGLEHPVVYILNENLIPSKYAKSSQQQKQEKNLKYVARTRASEELYYLNL